MQTSYVLSDSRAVKTASDVSRKEFVSFDTSRNPAKGILRFDAKDAGIAADVNVTGKRDLLREREDELDGTACIGRGFDQEIKTTEADVARFTLFFCNAIIAD